jgi:large subunit ribosomal protein L13e
MHHIKPQILKPDERQRVGKGFSREELKKAGINLQEARRIELPIDFRRRTAHDENVETVKTYAAQEKAKPKPVTKPMTAKTDAKQKKEKPKS